jgi:hypothetical protein
MTIGETGMTLHWGVMHEQGKKVLEDKITTS